jgi:acyl-CoA reductase-like NAD-dependent aldehyde dehydrogenase
MAQPLKNWVDNVPVATTGQVSDSTKFVPVTSPANGQTISYVPLSSDKDVDLAVSSADKAFQTWGFFFESYYWLALEQ